eukprot:CAMPEP_0117683408 /NCGR_PEP_ID=MMETSP0804-20121206/20373_1 /TAXON_ID=1074897 /ORGANISM="Tetraselmis astigmatica, Strain CCMP880" /LENGTH=74 /DNA_ID=CAMNT_0005493977 /DNA_START=48 /DNA_END=268 /DNA_ORIENTATION=-
MAIPWQGGPARKSSLPLRRPLSGLFPPHSPGGWAEGAEWSPSSQVVPVRPSYSIPCPLSHDRDCLPPPLQPSPA